MLDPKEAAFIAAGRFEEFYPNEPFEDIRLEEVGRVEENTQVYWLITLGYVDKSLSTDRSAVNSLLPNASRSYKRFRANAETGDVVWIKIFPSSWGFGGESPSRNSNGRRRSQPATSLFETRFFRASTKLSQRPTSRPHVATETGNF